MLDEMILRGHNRLPASWGLWQWGSIDIRCSLTQAGQGQRGQVYRRAQRRAQEAVSAGEKGERSHMERLTGGGLQEGRVRVGACDKGGAGPSRREACVEGQPQRRLFVVGGRRRGCIWVWGCVGQKRGEAGRHQKVLRACTLRQGC